MGEVEVVEEDLGHAHEHLGALHPPVVAPDGHLQQHSTVQYSTVTLRRFFTRLIYNDMLFIYRTFILQHLTADCLEDISADPGLGTLWEFSHYQMDSYKSPNIAGCKVYVLNLTHLKHHVSCLQTIKSEVLIE